MSVIHYKLGGTSFTQRRVDSHMADFGPRQPGPNNTNIPGHDAGSTSRSKLLSWVMFDWANSAFSTVILTFVFSAYFTRQVAPDAITGTRLWGL